MNQRQTGLIIVVLSIIMFITLVFLTIELKNAYAELHKICPLPEGICPFNKALPTPSIFAFIFVILTAAFGIYLIFEKKETSKAKIKELKISLKELNKDEKKILELVADEGAIFQATLAEKAVMSKVKVTRILDTLEGKGLIERKRRGMSNVVILK